MAPGRASSSGGRRAARLRALGAPGPAGATSPEPRGPRWPSRVLETLQQEGGSTLRATKWQPGQNTPETWLLRYGELVAREAPSGSRLRKCGAAGSDVTGSRRGSEGRSEALLGGPDLPNMAETRRM